MAFRRKSTKSSSRSRRSSTSARARSTRSSSRGRGAPRRVARRVSSRRATGRGGGSQTIRLVLEQPAAVPIAATPEQTIAQSLAQIAANSAVTPKGQKAKF